MIAMKITLTMTVTYLQLETRIMHYRNLAKQILDSNRQRKPLTVIRHFTLWSKHPILHSNIFFYVKLFATIILSWNSLKCILWYLLELSDPFIKNENSVLPILIEKNFEQKIYFCLLKMKPFFLKKGIPIFSIKLGQRLPKSFSQLYVKNLRFFLSYFLKKDDRPKAIWRWSIFFVEFFTVLKFFKYY